MVGQTPAAPEGSEVRPLTQEEINKIRKELKKRIEKIEANIGDAYATILISAYDLGRVMMETANIKENLQLYLEPEDIEGIEERIEEIRNNLKGISLNLIHLGRKLVVKE
jgi:vacuolar-type H+-ATPase subunit E/Vma4